jgi:hypothetical protein
MNVDAEIYLKNLIGFFETNPDQLKNLIGELDKDKFFSKVRDKVYSNIKEDKEEFILTRKEMIDIIKDLFDENTPLTEEQSFEMEAQFMKTEFGLFSLN